MAAPDKSISLTDIRDFAWAFSAAPSQGLHNSKEFYIKNGFKGKAVKDYIKAIIDRNPKKYSDKFPGINYLAVAKDTDQLNSFFSFFFAITPGEKSEWEILNEEIKQQEAKQKATEEEKGTEKKEGEDKRKAAVATAPVLPLAKGIPMQQPPFPAKQPPQPPQPPQAGTQPAETVYPTGPQPPPTQRQMTVLIERPAEYTQPRSIAEQLGERIPRAGPVSAGSTPSAPASPAITSPSGSGGGVPSPGGAARGIPRIPLSSLGRGLPALGRGIPAAASLAARAGGIFAALGSLGWLIGIVLIVTIGIFIFWDQIKNTALLPIPGQLPPTTQACFPAGAGGASTGSGGCPSLDAIAANRKTTPETCRYFDPTVPLFTNKFSSSYPYGDLTDAQMTKFVERFWPEAQGKYSSKDEFIRRANYIKEKAESKGINPVIGLAYWRSESKFGESLGCVFVPNNFNDQVECALGLSDGPGVSPAKCLVSRDASSPSCKFYSENRNNKTPQYSYQGQTLSNYDIYKDQPITLPLQTLDDFAEVFGSRSPLLEAAEQNDNVSQNNNCIHSYNDIVELAVEVNACDPKGTPILQSSQPVAAQTGTLAACKFTKSDQGARASLPYQSSKLLSYFQEASQKSTVPASVLAGIARVESTTGTYTISDYTDEDISYIENRSIPNVVLTDSNSASEIAKIKSLKIPGTEKAVCPVSSNNALGVMQIQPPGTNGHAKDAVQKGAELIGKSVNNLTLKDYCDPRKNITMAGGFILAKMGASSWNPQWTNDKTKVSQLARSYYGGLIYGDADQYNYGDDLFESISSCSAGQVSSSLLQRTVTKPPIVVLDPGHCSNDKYKENKAAENKLNIEQAKKLASLLQKNGIDAKVYNPNSDGSCEEVDYYENLQKRVDFANSNNTAAFISIHADAGVQTNSFGPIYSEKGPFSSESKRLGETMGQAVTKQLKNKVSGITFKVDESTKVGTDQGTDDQEGLEYYVLGPQGAKTGGYYGGKVPSIQRKRKMPGIIMKNYMKTKSDYSDLYAYTDDIALGYCNGISNFLGGQPCKPGGGGGLPSSGLGSAGLLPVCSAPPSVVLGKATCPIPGGKIICSSYGSEATWSGFDGVCALGSNSSTGENNIGGHCSPKYRAAYPGLCDDKNYISGGNLKRTAKSIDIGGKVGENVYIPTINGQVLKWNFINDFPDGIGATLRVFQSEQTAQGKWTMHFIHAIAEPSFTPGQGVDTTKPIAQISSASGPGYHIHVTVGLNIAEPITANNLQLYDPGWKYPDRDLGMCTQ